MTTDDRGCPQWAPPCQEWSYRYSPTMLVWTIVKGMLAQGSVPPSSLGTGKPRSS